MEHSLTDYFELEEVPETKPQEAEITETTEPSENTESSDNENEEAENVLASDNVITYDAVSLETADEAEQSEKPPEEVPSEHKETA